MFISIIIATRNRADSLRQTLVSLFCPGNLESPNWEVLVVETSTDHTTEVCREFQQRFPQHFRFLTEKRLGKSNALNTAIAAARGDILAFTDDDVVCAPDYIQGIRTVFSLYAADAAQGLVLLDCEGGWPQWLDRNYLALMADFRDCGDEVIDLDRTLFGLNMVVRAEVFKKIGGFAPESGPGGVGMWEDTEISLRMRRAGFRLVYARNEYRDPVEVQSSLAPFRHFYNHERPHHALGYRVPADLFCRKSNARPQSFGSAL